MNVHPTPPVTQFDDNIVKQIRTAAHMTQEQLADRVGVTVMFIIRAEQNLHPHISLKLATALSEITSDAGHLYPSYIQKTYMQKRLYNIQQFGISLQSDPYYRSNVKKAIDYAMDRYERPSAVFPVSDRRFYHPFTLFRTYLLTMYDYPASQIKFCALTGLHPAILSSLELGKVSLDEDGAIASTLKEVFALTEAEIATLVKMCDDYVS